MSQQINLYNPIFLKQEKYFSARTIGQALGLIAIGLGAFYVFALMETRSAERLANEYRAQVESQRAQFVALGPKLSVESRSKALESEVARLESEVKARQSLLATLSTGELGNTAGFSDFLAALGRQAVPGVWLTGISIGEAGNDLLIQGRALRPALVPTYLKALTNEPMMRGRQVTEMKLASAQAAQAGPGAREKRTLEPGRYIEFSVLAPLTAPDGRVAKQGTP